MKILLLSKELLDDVSSSLSWRLRYSMDMRLTPEGGFSYRPWLPWHQPRLNEQLWKNQGLGAEA